MVEVLTKAPPALSEQRIDRLPLLITDQGEPIVSLPAWEQQRARIEADWSTYLGSSPYPELPRESHEVRTDNLGDCTGTLVHLRTEPDYFEQCYLMVPAQRPTTKLPAVIIFFYDLDTPAGHNMGGRLWKPGSDTQHFARHLVRRGYVTLVQRWFHEGYADYDRAATSLQKRYGPGAERFAQKAPGWKGLGRVVWDASRCVDYLQSLDLVDPSRIGCMGHSLGGKIALYASAFEPRLQVVVSSEPGIGLAFSNWNDPWYLGPEVASPTFPRDHHQLLALIAPRPFLLIAGEDSDGDKSWPYLNSAQDVYQLYGDPQRIGMINHKTGHSPTRVSLELAYQWFDRWL